MLCKHTPPPPPTHTHTHVSPFQAELKEASDKVAKVEAALAVLEETLAAATAKRTAAEAEAARCASRLSLASRLVNGLASENERWGLEVARLRAAESLLIGDVLLASVRRGGVCVCLCGWVGGFEAT